MESKTNGTSLRITRMSRSSWFKIEWNGKLVHLDPGYSGNYENQGIPEHELGQKADLVLITHSHKDHIQPEALAKVLKSETDILAPKSCQELIDRPFTLVKPGDRIDLGWIHIAATEAYNTPEGRSTQKFHHKGDFVGYLIDLGERRLYFPGDSDLIPEMQYLGKVDLAFLPIGGTYVMDIDEAVEAVKVIRPGVAIPMHQASADMGLFAQKMRRQTSCVACLLNNGDSFTFEAE